MIHLSIAYDEQDIRLGTYFNSSKKHLIDYINEYCNFEYNIIEIPSRDCTESYMDKHLPTVNSSNFIFAAYSHGNHEALLIADTNNSYVHKTSNAYLFTKALFYSMSCSTGKELGDMLITHGSNTFVGFVDTSYTLPDEYSDLSIQCDNYAITRFISGQPIGKCVEEMKKFITTKIDYLISINEVLHASILIANRESLGIKGNEDLTILDFVRNGTPPSSQQADEQIIA